MLRAQRPEEQRCNELATGHGQILPDLSMAQQHGCAYPLSLSVCASLPPGLGARHTALILREVEEHILERCEDEQVRMRRILSSFGAEFSNPTGQSTLETDSKYWCVIADYSRFYRKSGEAAYGVANQVRLHRLNGEA
jgi:hypothetical protein